MPSADYLEDLAFDVAGAALGDDEGGATDVAGDLGGGLLEDDLLGTAVGALDFDEISGHSNHSVSSNFFARMHGEMLAFLHWVHLYLRLILLVGFSLPSGLGLGKPP